MIIHVFVCDSHDDDALMSQLDFLGCLITELIFFLKEKYQPKGSSSSRSVCIHGREIACAAIFIHAI